MELGLYTFGDLVADPRSGRLPTARERMRQMIDMAILADEAGLDIVGVGEHHGVGFVNSATAVTIAAMARATKQIRLTSAVTLLSTADPVRTFQEFATADPISDGRVELIFGRGAFTESFPLFGFDLRDYDALFAEKLGLFAEINAKEYWRLWRRHCHIKAGRGRSSRLERRANLLESAAAAWQGSKNRNDGFPQQCVATPVCLCSSGSQHNDCPHVIGLQLRRSPLRDYIVASDIPALLDGQYLDLVIGHQHYISHGFADESTRHWGDVGDRSVPRIRFVFPDDSEGPAPTVVTLEHHLMSKSDCAELYRSRNDLSGRQTIGVVSHFPRGDRDSSTTFAGVLDLLRRGISGATFGHRVGQCLQT